MVPSSPHCALKGFERQRLFKFSVLVALLVFFSGTTPAGVVPANFSFAFGRGGHSEALNAYFLHYGKKKRMSISVSQSRWPGLKIERWTSAPGSRRMRRKTGTKTGNWGHGTVPNHFAGNCG